MKEIIDGEKDFALDIVLRQFKHSKTGKENVGCFEIKDLGSGTTGEYETQGSGKRKRGLFLLVALAAIYYSCYL